MDMLELLTEATTDGEGWKLGTGCWVGRHHEAALGPDQ